MLITRVSLPPMLLTAFRKSNMNYPRRAAILHGYSSAKKGDGMLVDRAIAIARGILGDDIEFTPAAHHQGSFNPLGDTVLAAGPCLPGFNREATAEP